MSSKLTFETIDGTYSIQVPDDCLDMPKVVTDLLIPLMLASGYHPNTVNTYLGDRDEIM